ncbi:MAG: cell division protein ZapB [Acidobacteriota bacterium]|nr:cell division protein ZapB [Acidobacteriota bacterium]
MKKTTTNEPMALSDSEEGEILARLSDRVEKAVTTIQELRRERDTLRQRVDELEARVRDGEDASSRLTTLEEEHDRFQKERGEVRNRIESILASLEQLEG